MGSSVWRAALTGYSLTWTRAATPQGRSLYRLRLSAPRIGGIASGSSRFWMTPNTFDAANAKSQKALLHEHDSARPGRTEPGNLRDQMNVREGMAMWPTPAKSDTEGSRTLPEGTSATGQRPDGKKAQVGLPNAVAMWPTPNSAKAGRPHEGNVRLLRAQVMSGVISEAEAEAMLGKSVWEAQGKIPAMWPTPRASEQENRTTKPTPSQLAGTHGRYLASEVQVRELLPTPQAFDAMGIERSPEALARAKESGGCANLREVVPAGQKLSAAWVNRLMMYPDGWLDLGPSDVDPIGKTACPE